MKLQLPSTTNSSMLDQITPLSFVQDGTSKAIYNIKLEDDQTFRLSSYIHRSSGYLAEDNQEENPSDHTYVSNKKWRPDFVFAKPLRTLFVHPSNDNENRDEDEIITVEEEPQQLSPVYDQAKATMLMEECERQVNFLHPDEGNPDWEEHIPRTNWTTMQTKLFNKVVRVLQCDRLARLAHQGSPNEPVLRRVTVDKTARRLRQLFASVAWNSKYTQWIHNILLDNVHTSYLVSYLDALQTLKTKVPMLVDRVLASTNTRASIATPNQELLNIVQRRPWDPLSVGIINYKPKKLPQDPILVMVPSGPGSSTSSNCRTHHWMANLSTLGTVVCVYSSPGKVAGNVSVTNCLDHMLASTRAKVAELHTDYSGKPIVLVGLGSGATLACQVALVENVTAVVCLGFSFYTVEDSRGTPDDTLLNLPAPVMFVIGQNASTTSVDDMEEMREKLNIVSSLVVVGGADDQLRLSKAKKKLDGITQTIVDKCVMDEVADFLGTILSPDYVPPIRPILVQPIDTPTKRGTLRTMEPKRKADPNNSDAPVPTPAKRGRKPKALMVQKTAQHKWSTQMNLATESPRTPIPLSSQVTLTNVGPSGRGGKRQATADLRKAQMTTAPLQPSLESTITVVAASNPNITSATTNKTCLPSGQLTSLSSILQPGTGGVTSHTVSTDNAVINVRSLNTTSTPDITDELNILDMPVILGDQNPDDLILPSQPQPMLLPKKASPVKLILTNAKSPVKQGISAFKYMGQSKQPVKIYISKPNQKALYVGSVPKPKIRNMPAVKHSQFS